MEYCHNHADDFHKIIDLDFRVELFPQDLRMLMSCVRFQDVPTSTKKQRT